MWSALFNGLAVGFALQLCYRLHRSRLAHRPIHTNPYATWMPPVITLTETGAVIAELYEPNPDWLVVGFDAMAVIIMLLISIRLWRRRHRMLHAPDPTNSKETK